MNQLAIDPGDRNLGYALLVDGRSRVYKFGTHVTQKEQNQWERIESIRIVIDQLITPTHELNVVIEDGYRRGALIRLIGYLAGYFTARGNLVKTPHPAVWPKQFFGQKKDYKKAAMRWCQRNGYKPLTQHEADALCLLEWGKKY
mgnify:CR=1 FL=1